MSVVDDVKQKTDIIDVIGQYVTLKKAGRNFKALCPFHSEKTPSFVVYPDEGTWHCFGACSTGGDVFAFLMKKENIDFGEALRRLAQRAGVELVRSGPGEDEERKRLRDLLQTAAARYHYWLKNHPAAQIARDYVAKRFISPETVELFELGYAPNEWDALKSYLVGREYSLRDLLVAGLVVESERGTHYDRFRGRLMFPIRNRTSEVIGFGARTLTGEEPKYLNSPQTPLFDKSATLYGLDLAKDAIRTENLAVIVEGYMDVIGAHQAGFKNVVASLGTALTEKQLALLKRLTKRYALALDPDAAGEEATKRGLEVAREALDRKTVPVPMGAGMIGYESRLEAELLVIPLPPGQDPDELIHDNPARWAELVTQAEPLVDFYFRVLTLDLQLDKARDKSIAVKRLVPIIREVGDKVQREHYTQQLARLVQVPEQTIAQEVMRSKKGVAKASGEETPAAAAPSATKLEEYCLTLALHDLRQLSAMSFLEPEVFDSADCRAVFQALLDFRERGITVRDEQRGALDTILVPLYDHLMELGQRLQDLTERDMARESEAVARRLRNQHDKAEVAMLEVTMRDKDDDRTPEEEHLLHERVAYLNRRIGEDHKALGRLTLLGSGRANATGSIR
jgi:DNA primase